MQISFWEIIHDVAHEIILFHLTTTRVIGFLTQVVKSFFSIVFTPQFAVCIDYFVFQIFHFLFLGQISIHFQWKHFFSRTSCCLTGALVSPASTPHPSPPHPLPLVRVDQYFPCSLSLMWNWLFIQTLLPLHKDLDGRDGTKDERSTGHATDTRLWTRVSGHASPDTLLDFYLFGKRLRQILPVWRRNEQRGRRAAGGSGAGKLWK